MLAAALSVSLFGGMTVKAAGDYEDKPFSFYIDGSGQYRDETANYAKYNTSSIYVYLTDTETGYARVEGRGFIGGRWSNETVGGVATLTLGQQRVRTNIVEHGGSGTQTKLHFNYYMSHSVNVGCWSPDCAGNYPAAN